MAATLLGRGGAVWDAVCFRGHSTPGWLPRLDAAGPHDGTMPWRPASAIWRGYAKVATRAPAPGRSHETTNGNASAKT